jgi:acetyl-CoA carboxylase biotin carboxyl carrier protein
MNLEKLRKVLEMVDKMNLAELELEVEDLKLKIKKISDFSSVPLPQSTPGTLPSSPVSSATRPIISSRDTLRLPVEMEFQAENTKIESKEKLVSIRSPIVGTFYRSSSPDADPYIKIGDVVSKGQVLCIVEAMKIMNEIESEYDGRIVSILVENEQPIEYDQELFLIEPK